jgi:hypothetical protein
MFDRYHPEQHYMRGSGPKCRLKESKHDAPSCCARESCDIAAVNCWRTSLQEGGRPLRCSRRRNHFRRDAPHDSDHEPGVINAL